MRLKIIHKKTLILSATAALASLPLPSHALDSIRAPIQPSLVESPYISCRKAGPRRDALKQYPNTLSVSCSDNSSIVPQTGIAKFSFGDELRDWTQASEFSQLVGQKTLTYLKNNERVTREMKACLDQEKTLLKKGKDSCKRYFDYFRDHVLPAEKSIRKYLAFAASPGAGGQDRGSTFDSILNRNLQWPPEWNLGAKSKEPLSASEIAERKKEYDAFLIAVSKQYQAILAKRIAALPEGSPEQKNAIREAQSFLKLTPDQLDRRTDPNWAAFKAEKLGTVRKAYQQRLMALLGTHRILAFTHSGEPGAADLSQALDQLLQKNKTATQRTDSLLTRAKDMNSVSMSDLYDLIDNPLLAEEVLAENPKFCAIATALAFHQENSEMRWALGTSVPLMVAGFVYPGAWLLGAGMAVQGYWVSERFDKLETAWNETMAGPGLKEAPLPRSFEETYLRSIDFGDEVLLSPLALMGTQLGKLKGVASLFR